MALGPAKEPQVTNKQDLEIPKSTKHSLFAMKLLLGVTSEVTEQKHFRLRTSLQHHLNSTKIFIINFIPLLQ